MAGRLQQLAREIRKRKPLGPPILTCLPRWAFRPGEERVVILQIGGRPATAKELSDFELQTLREWVAAARAVCENVEQQEAQQSHPNSTTATERPDKES
jgi:hypothetical protein